MLKSNVTHGKIILSTFFNTLCVDGIAGIMPVYGCHHIINKSLYNQGVKG
jgi:hypothetical protein